jgi:hypothetical protein
VNVCDADAVPSVTVTVNDSEVSVVLALIADALGVYVYAPDAWFTVSVPYVPAFVTTPPLADPESIPYVREAPVSRSAPDSVPVSFENESFAAVSV